MVTGVFSAWVAATVTTAAVTVPYTGVTGTPTSLASINATEGSKLSGVAAGATKNIVTRSSTAPTGAVDGDVWVDTSVTPNVTRVRVSGSFQIAANYVTNTNQVTDGAGLGQTAVYTSVSGTPTSLAAINGTEATKLSGIAAGATVGAPAGTNVAGVSASTLVSNASTALSTANSAASGVTSLNGRVTTTESNITTLQGYAETRWTVSAVDGAGRAQLSVHADANGGGGVDIVGDVGISGNLIVSGTVTTTKIASGAVTAPILGSGAAQRAMFWSTTSDLAIPDNSVANVATLSFEKLDSDSVLELQFFANVSSPDDIQFTGGFLIDGTQVQTCIANIILDTRTSSGRMPITPFAFIAGVSAGSHIVAFNVINNETDNVSLTVLAGSTLKVVELRNASAGSSTGSQGGVISSGTPGDGGGGDYGGGTGGGSGGGGLDNPLP